MSLKRETKFEDNVIKLINFKINYNEEKDLHIYMKKKVLKII